MNRIPVVLDTDIGTDVDDALFLLMALASPEIDLIAVTIVDGHVDQRAQIAARLLGMAGRADIPVYMGAQRPLAEGRGPTWFGHEGRGVLDMPYEGPVAQIHTLSASEFMVEASKKHPYHLVAIGPFTNVALAFQLDPSLAQRLIHLTVMGGMVHPETYTAKWQQFFADTRILPAHMDHNTASDVRAALAVATAGIDMTWVTAEITFCTPLNKRAIELFRSSDTHLGNAMAAMLSIWNDEWFHFIPQFPDYPSPFPEDAVACLHDPLALASLFPQQWMTLEKQSVRFAIEGHLFRIHPVTTSIDAYHQISVEVDTAAFETFYLERIETFLKALSA